MTGMEDGSDVQPVDGKAGPVEHHLAVLPCSFEDRLAAAFVFAASGLSRNRALPKRKHIQNKVKWFLGSVCDLSSFRPELR